jgi:hypothetical protein
VLRGLQPWRYRRLENTIAFTGIASYIGNRRGVQCADGPVMSKFPDTLGLAKYIHGSSIELIHSAHIFDYSTEIEEKEKVNDGYLGHANRTSFLVRLLADLPWFKEVMLTTT